MKTLRFAFFNLTVTLMVCSGAHAGLGNAKALVLEELASQDLEVETDISIIDLEDTFGVDLDVGVAVRPNRDKETYSRFESIDLETSLDTGFADIAPVFVKGLRGRNIKVVRQFATQREAVNLRDFPTWTWKNLPYNAENALAMPNRTIVSFKSELSVEFGVQAAVEQGLQKVSGGVSYVAYGDFLVEIFKSTGKKVLVRFVSRQDQSRSVSAQWKAGPDLQIFPKVLEKEVEKLLDVTVGFSAAKSKGHLLVFEYIFDLENKEAQMAFNKVVDPSLWNHFRDVYKISNPLGDQQDGDEVALLRFAETEALAKKSLGKQRPAVVSNVQGESDYRRSQKGIKASILIAKSSRENNFVEMDFDFKDVHGGDKAFRISNLTLSQSRSFLFETLRRRSVQQIDAVLSLVPRPVNEMQKSTPREILDFQSLVVTCSRDEKTRTAIEQRGVDAALRLMIPERYHDRLETNTIQTNALVADARTDVSLVLDRKAFLKGSLLSREQIRRVLVKHINRLADNAGPLGGGPYGNTWGYERALDPISDDDYTPPIRYPKGIKKGAWARSNLEDIREILQKLPKVLRDSSADRSQVSQESKVERWNTFKSLRDNRLFKIAGAGFLTRVVDRADAILGNDQPQTDFPTGVSLSVKTIFRKFRGNKSQKVFEVQLGNLDSLVSYGAIDRIRREVLNSEFRIEDYDEAFEKGHH